MFGGGEADLVIRLKRKGVRKGGGAIMKLETKLTARVRPKIVFSTAKINFGTPSLSHKDKSGVFPLFFATKNKLTARVLPKTVFSSAKISFGTPNLSYKDKSGVFPLVSWRFA